MSLFQWWTGAEVADVEVVPLPISDPCALCDHVHEETVVDPCDMHRRITYVARCWTCGCVADATEYKGRAA